MSHTDHTTQSSPTPGRQRMSPEMQRQIDENLRRLYRQSADEALPDRLQSLLDRLRAQDGGQ